MSLSGFSLVIISIIGYFVFKIFIKEVGWIISTITLKISLKKKYLTLQSGIFTKNISDISLEKLEGFNLHQSLLGRLLNYGTLTISTGGVIQKYQIRKPQEFRKQLLATLGN